LKKAGCSDFSAINKIENSSNSLELRIIHHCNACSTFSHDKVLIIINDGKNWSESSYIVDSSNILSSNCFTKTNIESEEGLEKLYYKLDSVGLFRLKLVEDREPSLYTKNGYIAPYILADDGVTYYFEIKSNKGCFMYEVDNPETNYQGLINFLNSTHNQILIQEIKVFIDSLRLLII
jgi:hypothetical protein